MVFFLICTFWVRHLINIVGHIYMMSGCVAHSDLVRVVLIGNLLGCHSVTQPAAAKQSCWYLLLLLQKSVFLFVHRWK